MKATAKTARTTRFRRRCLPGPRRPDRAEKMWRGGCCAWRGGRYRFTVDCAISYPRALSQVPTDGIVKKRAPHRWPGSSLSRVDATANPQLAPSCDAPVLGRELCRLLYVTEDVDRHAGEPHDETRLVQEEHVASPRVRCQEEQDSEAKRMTVRIATNGPSNRRINSGGPFSRYSRDPE